jgi:GntR family transcriptional regulator
MRWICNNACWHEVVDFLNLSVIVNYNTNSLNHPRSFDARRMVHTFLPVTLAGAHPMSADWNDNSPIYRQLKAKVVGMMLDGALQSGDALPSVRQVAADYQLNPITVSRAYQELVDEALVEKRRGLGMYVLQGARDKLLASERERFMREEWPAMLERITRLGLDVEQLLLAHKGATP